MKLRTFGAGLVPGETPGATPEDGYVPSGFAESMKAFSRSGYKAAVTSLIDALIA
jgi:hypothetical protein